MNRLLPWLRYYVPLSWTINTRYMSAINVISFLLIDAFPSLYVVLFFCERSFITVFYWGLAFFTVFCFYECGYIFNEVISVQFEKNPTIRIPKMFFDRMNKHLENLITIRIVIGVIFSWILLSRYPDNTQIYICEVLLLLLAYTIHNFFRGSINALTMPIEVTLKYMIPITVFVPYYDLAISFFIIFFSIVLVRLIEYISKKKKIFRINSRWIIHHESVDRYRLKYYLIICSFIGVLSFYDFVPWGLYGLPLFFFLYRGLCYYAMYHIRGISHIIHTGRKRDHTERE